MGEIEDNIHQSEANTFTIRSGSIFKYPVNVINVQGITTQFEIEKEIFKKIRLSSESHFFN